MFIDFLNMIMTWAASTGIKIVIAAVIMVVSFVIINAVGRKLREKLMQQGKLDITVAKTLCSFLMIGLKVLVAVAMIGYLGIDIGGISAVIASMGVCVGLAVNGTLSNLAGGIMLLIIRPFKLGDYISAQGKDGTVENIGICYTKITTVDNKTVYLPNSAVSTGVIENFSEKNIRRVDLTFSVAGNDPVKVRQLLLDVCAKEEKVLDTPAPFVRIIDYGAGNGVKMVLRAWCDSANYWDCYFNLLDDVQKAFDAEGIVVPFNQLDVHIKN